MPTKKSRKENENRVSQEIKSVPDYIFIYKAKSNLDWDALSDYLSDRIGRKITIELRENFLSYKLIKAEQHRDHTPHYDEIAKKLASTKVFDMQNPKKIYEPFLPEIEHEKKLLNEEESSPLGTLYDGFRLQVLFKKLIEKKELSFKHVHIILTNRLVGTWDPYGKRYHARTSVYGIPSIISLPGIVEAPARPREYYLLRQNMVASGIPRAVAEVELKRQFRDRFIEHDDERFTEAIKGYLMQALFYQITFEPFCEDRNCRLYNAHWQEDMINAQLKGGEFCKRHEGILQNIRASD